MGNLIVAVCFHLSADVSPRVYCYKVTYYQENIY